MECDTYCSHPERERGRRGREGEEEKRGVTEYWETGGMGSLICVMCL